VAGVLSVLLAAGRRRAQALSEQTRAGQLGYNALLRGAGRGLDPALSAAAVTLTRWGSWRGARDVGSARSVSVARGLPMLTLPFLVVFGLLLGAVNTSGHARARGAGHVGAARLELLFSCAVTPEPGHARVPARVDVGLIVLIGLAMNSRIAVMLSMMAFVAAAMLVPVLAPAEVDLVNTLGLNAMLPRCARRRVFVPGGGFRTRSRWARRGVHPCWVSSSERSARWACRC